MSKRNDVTGLKYGHLTGIRYLRTEGRDRAAIWLFRCDCGNEKEIETRRVTAGRTRTCGMCQLKHKLKASSMAGSLQKNRKLVKEFQKYIRVAQRRGIKWALSVEEFNKLAHSCCTLCNNPPPSSGFNKVEPLGNEDGFTVGGCYVRCSLCEQSFSKIGISLLIDRVVAVYKNLTK